jgi:itaconyl-CoA hydratase
MTEIESEIIIWHKARYFDEFVVGGVLDHHWGRTLTQSDNLLFTTGTLGFNPLYFNDVHARELGYKGCVLNPYLVLLTAIGLSTQDLSEGSAAFLGMDSVRFHEPMFPEETLKARSTVLSARSSGSRPGHGIVTWRTVGLIDDNLERPVVELERSNLLPTRQTAEQLGRVV